MAPLVTINWPLSWCKYLYNATALLIKDGNLEAIQLGKECVVEIVCTQMLQQRNLAASYGGEEEEVMNPGTALHSSMTWRFTGSMSRFWILLMVISFHIWIYWYYE